MFQCQQCSKRARTDAERALHTRHTGHASWQETVRGVRVLCVCVCMHVCTSAGPLCVCVLHLCNAIAQYCLLQTVDDAIDTEAQMRAAAAEVAEDAAADLELLRGKKGGAGGAGGADAKPAAAAAAAGGAAEGGAGGGGAGEAAGAGAGGDGASSSGQQAMVGGGGVLWVWVGGRGWVDGWVGEGGLAHACALWCGPVVGAVNCAHTLMHARTRARRRSSP